MLKSSHEYDESRRFLAQAIQVKAASRYRSGDLEGAATEISRAIGLHEYHALRAGSNHDARTLLSMFEDLARYRFEHHDFPQAYDAYQRIIHLYGQMLAKGRKRPDWLEARASAEIRAAACNSQLVQPNEAVIALEVAEQDLASAWDLFGGESIYHEKVSSVYVGLGHSFLVVGDVEQAERALRLSLESMERSARNVEPTPSNCIAWHKTIFG